MLSESLKMTGARRHHLGVGFLCLFALPVWAHGPWDCSVRVIAGSGNVEVAVTAGEELARRMLAGMKTEFAQIQPQQVTRLPGEFARLVCTVTAGRAEVAVDSFGVIGDGLEYQFILKQRTPGGWMGLKPGFLTLLPASSQVALTMTDEVGNTLTNVLLSVQQPVVELALPLENALPTGDGSERAVTAPVAQPSSKPEAASAAPSAGGFPDWGWALGIILILPVWWLVQSRVRR